jgi:lysophospholipase L1-like esterase
MVSSWFSAIYPDRNVKFINRGMSGNRVRNLIDRWKKDCLDLKPDIVSILIGINDIFGNGLLGWNNSTPIDRFETDYRKLLEITRKFLNAKIILLEPFLLYVTKEQFKYKEKLHKEKEIVNKLSREYETFLIPLDQIFLDATRKKEPSFWAQDGVHPTLVGHALISQSWLKIIERNSVDSF